MKGQGIDRLMVIKLFSGNYARDLQNNTFEVSIVLNLDKDISSIFEMTLSMKMKMLFIPLP